MDLRNSTAIWLATVLALAIALLEGWSAWSAGASMQQWANERASASTIDGAAQPKVLWLQMAVWGPKDLTQRSTVNQEVSSFATLDQAVGDALQKRWWLSAGVCAAAVVLAAFFLISLWQRRVPRVSQVSTASLQSRATTAQVDLQQAFWDGRCAERHELARELHDEFGQGLTVMCTAAAYVERHAGVANAEVLAECGKDIREAAVAMGSQLRGMLVSLRPQGLNEFGMLQALKALLQRSRMGSVGIELEVCLPENLPPLSDAAALALYRTLQESLSNVLKHANATRVEVRLERKAQGVSLTVQDNGGGNAKHALANARGGLTGMKERVAMAHGHWRLEDCSRGGLQLVLWLPTSKAQERGDKDAESSAAG